MLIRRFSLRSLFVLTTAVSLFSLVLVAAVRGANWAQAIVAAVLFLVLAFVNYSIAFATAWLLTSNWRRRPPAPQSPFATDSLPRQIIPPPAS